ncbi:hypothetical protein [Shouchella miscanthi]|uniref:Phage tail protein n=1 Tax=Shouchella miscanthi TaxID=2598861 RepID=A0ABU6NK62_9BACI|nr:hypothetical protein [Shouchella miscanthi]
MQMYVPFISSDIYVRTSDNNGNWRGWNKQATDGELKAHSNATNNPHNVTKSQVGLSNVQNFGVSNQATAEAGTNNSVYMTPLRTKQAIDKLRADKTPADRAAVLNPTLKQLSEYTIPDEFYLTTEEYMKMTDTPTNDNNLGWWGYNSYADAGEGLIQTLTANTIGNHIVYTRVIRRNSVGAWSLTSNADTGWVDMAVSGGLWANGNDTVRMRRIGNVVYCKGSIRGVPGDDTLICVIPEQFRPDKNLTMTNTGILNFGTVHTHRLDINMNGNFFFVRSTLRSHNGYTYDTWYSLDGLVWIARD